ncbi:hypothetical protein OBBRIDRAFT_559083 [Obba rivulosa]|uniref:RRM domain-containing protein n=1 Tax=Obba rivulosa TaxID=1052685 RepID=A0A8E2B2E8_9APHY|nr:hypothetical protein OBBRIDRAFT_559083 [Obba rivulosa]
MSSSSESEYSSDAAESAPTSRPQVIVEPDASDASADPSSSDSDSGDSSDAEESSEAAVLSHAQKRKQKKKELKAITRDNQDAEVSKKKVKNTAELAPSKIPKRQNSVWVGNLSFKTTPEALRKFFDGAGEITRLHMPMKTVAAGPGGGGARKENRGFAYVDFATPDAKTVAITLSENPLDGRRLLIKDGDDFAGRPSPSTPSAAEGSADAGTSKLTGHTKTAQKILRNQKQPAGPTLFLGNLGFETTEQSIRQMLDSHRSKPPKNDTGEAEEGGAGKWIRKIRMGTFEDSGKCKGWAFVDFTSTEHATAALVNPRNHHLDGRDLVVEYASPEAVRRGGGAPGAPRISKEKRVGPRQERLKARTEKRKATEDETGVDVHDEQPAPKRQKAGSSPEKPVKNREDRHNDKRPRPRAKPGAALALAKRESAAIVPSQGKKIVF